MSKKNALTPQEVQQTITNYLQALRLAEGDNRAAQTEITYRKGWFYLQPPGRSPEVLGVPYRPHEIQEMTAELQYKHFASGRQR